MILPILLVGTTGYQYPPRRYSVEPGILKEGKNTLVVRVVNNSGRGGFITDKPYFLAVGKDTIDLKGTWKYELGATMEPLKSQTFIRWKPGGLYNSMIAPLLSYKIKGVIWYQGESNTRDPQTYAKAFPSMIRDWRRNFNHENMPFLFVQLANFMEEKNEPVESKWAELRQAQLNTLSVPHTGMAVAIDLGEWNDIHPLNKEDVGKRLALEARKVAYKEAGITSSPVPAGADFKKDHVTIKFENTAGKLITKNGREPAHFEISADGRKFIRAKAKIQGSSIKIWHKKVINPVAVRYAWADNPNEANLYNKDGLPASPFEIRK